MENRHPVEFGPHKQAANERKTMQKLQQELPSTFLEFSRKNPDKGSNSTTVPSSSTSTVGEEGMILPTLQHTLEGQWKINDPRARALTYKIVEMIVIDNQPLNMVRDLGFTRLMNYVRPRYNIPSRSHITNYIAQCVCSG